MDVVNGDAAKDAIACVTFEMNVGHGLELRAALGFCRKWMVSVVW